MFWLYWGITASQILRKSLPVVCAKEAQAQSPLCKAYLCKTWCQIITGESRRAQTPGAHSPRRLNFLQYVFIQHDSWPCWTLHQTSSSNYHATPCNSCCNLTVCPLSPSNSQGIVLLHNRLLLCLNMFAYEQDNFTKLYRNRWKRWDFKQ